MFVAAVSFSIYLILNIVIFSLKMRLILFNIFLILIYLSIIKQNGWRRAKWEKLFSKKQIWQFYFSFIGQWPHLHDSFARFCSLTFSFWWRFTCFNHRTNFVLELASFLIFAQLKCLKTHARPQRVPHNRTLFFYFRTKTEPFWMISAGRQRRMGHFARNYTIGFC